MSLQKCDISAPNKMFRAVRVAPTLESAADSCDEFAAGMADAMRLEREIAGARRDYDARVAEAAYFLAQKRGFEPGQDLDDWVAAERLIAAQSKHSESNLEEPQS